MPVERPESRWAELGLEAIGRMPRAGDLVAFRAEMRLLRVAAAGPETVALEGDGAAPGDEREIGTRMETPLRDYLEAGGRARSRRPATAPRRPVPQLRRAPRPPAELRSWSAYPPSLAPDGRLRTLNEDGETASRGRRDDGEPDQGQPASLGRDDLMPEASAKPATSSPSRKSTPGIRFVAAW